MNLFILDYEELVVICFDKPEVHWVGYVEIKEFISDIELQDGKDFRYFIGVHC